MKEEQQTVTIAAAAQQLGMPYDVVYAAVRARTQAPGGQLLAVSEPLLAQLQAEFGASAPAAPVQQRCARCRRLVRNAEPTRSAGDTPFLCADCSAADGEQPAPAAIEKPVADMRLEAYRQRFLQRWSTLMAIPFYDGREVAGHAASFLPAVQSGDLTQTRLQTLIHSESGDRPLQIALSLIQEAEPLTAGQLLALLLSVAADAERLDQSIVIGLVSAEGWQREACDMLAGDTPGRGWAHGLVHPILVDLRDGRRYIAPHDALAQAYRPLFAHTSVAEDQLRVQQTVARRCFPGQSIALRDIVADLDLSATVVAAVFEQLATGDRYFVEAVADVGLVLAARY